MIECQAVRAEDVEALGSRHWHNTLEEVRRCWAKYHAADGHKMPMPDRYEEQGDDTDQARFRKNEQHPVGNPHGSTDGSGPHGRADEPGIYQVNNRVYKLRPSTKTGRLYAMLLCMDGDGKPYWQYAKGKVFEIKRRHKMTSEQASKYGRLHGRCVNCHTPIVRGESLRRGYGPDCATNNGWEYDHTSKD